MPSNIEFTHVSDLVAIGNVSETNSQQSLHPLVSGFTNSVGPGFHRIIVT